MKMVYKNFQQAYYNMIDTVTTFGNSVTVRGYDMKEIIPGYFEIANPRDRLLNIDCRSNITKYIFGELLWYLTGRDDVTFIDKYSKQWAKLSDDGQHCNSAYGKYIFNKMPAVGYGSIYDVPYSEYVANKDNYKSQWEYVKETLRKDPYSRQAVIHIKPVQMYDTKDVTCTYFLQFFIRNNKLDMIAGMRSNDLLFGTTYDVFMFTFLQELMAAELGVGLGTYKHFASNMHIYAKDREKIDAILSENADKPTFKFEAIPESFREHDVPILVDIEKLYWEKDSKYQELIRGLSKVGKQLVSLLIKGKDESVETVYNNIKDL